METELNTNKLLDFIAKKFEAGQLNNDSLVQIIELCGSYLNIQTIADYSKDNGMSYNGAKNFREGVTLFNTKFIIDNQ